MSTTGSPPFAGSEDSTDKPEHVPPSRPPGGLPAELLSRIWQQSLPLMRERVAVLQQAAQLACSDALSLEARTGAADLAHKLAGSLGMFGFPQGTEIAREMEQILEAKTSPDASRLHELAERLRSVLPL